MTSRDDETEWVQRLQEAGSRPDVAPERIAAAMAAARPAWETKVAEQGQKRRSPWRSALIAAALAGIAIFAGWWTRSEIAPAPTIAWVERTSDDVLVDGQPLTAGDPITAGAQIESQGLLALRLKAGGSLRLAAGTKLRLNAPRQATLESGGLYFDSGFFSNNSTRGVALSALTVTTSLGVVRDIGTQFELRLLSDQLPTEQLQTDLLQIRVREGEVEVSREEHRHFAGVGEELRLDLEGQVTRAQLPPNDPVYAWIFEAGPPFDLENRGLIEFFQWSARELGLELVWATTDLRTHVETITFHGSIVDLTPLEALEVVASATGLTIEAHHQKLDIGVKKPAP